MGLIHGCQQFDVGTRVATRKPVTAIGLWLHLLAAAVLSDQTGRLRPAQACHFLDVGPHQALTATPQFLVLLVPQHLIYPSVYFLPIPSLELDFTTALHKCPDLLQAQLGPCSQADDQFPASRTAPSGSS